MRRHNCKIGSACERCETEDRARMRADILDDAINLAAVVIGLALVALVCWVFSN